MSFEIAVQRMMEYARLVCDAEITDSGVYISGEVPNGSSAAAVIEVCFAVVSTDINGRLLFTMYNPPLLKNKDNETGMPIVVGNRTVRAGSGTPNIELTWRLNTNLHPLLQESAKASWERFQLQMANNTELGDWTI